MDLLVIKSGSTYIRVQENSYQPSDLTKASVFPLAQIATVKGHLKKLDTLGFKEVHLKRLVITEEPFDMTQL